MTSTVDAISLEVFKHLFTSVAEDMGGTLQRSSFSPNIKERLDFSCAMFDAAGRMVAQAAHIPVHLGSMPASVKAAIDNFPSLQQGDVIILNDPYRGGTHLPDITMVSPVFMDNERVFFVASRAHHADIGGMSPGSLPLSTELYQEGVIIPPIKLMDSGVKNDAVLALITANSRTPQERLGDLDAQLAAQHVGSQRIQSMIDQYGLETVNAHSDALQDYAHQMTTAIIRNIPDGTYHYQDFLESQEGEQLKIACTLTVDGETITVDFSDSAPQTKGNLNAVPAIVESATMYCIQLLAKDDVPTNHGSFQPITVITKSGTILNPQFPAAVAVGNTETSQRIVDVVLGALAQALPEKIPAASQGSMNNFTFGGMYQGKPFVYYETIGGGHGASPTHHGMSGRHSHMTNTLNTPIESLEMVLPVRVTAYHLRDGTGGKGQYHGGNGIRRVYEFLAPATVTFNTERRKLAPYGLNQGTSGASGKNMIIRADGTKETIPAKYTTQVYTGDRVVIETPSGGGWGKPIS